MRNPINLRVYRRTHDHLVLLWNTKTLTEEQTNHINIVVHDDGQDKPVEFVLAEDVEQLLGEKVSIPDSTAMAAVSHVNNDLDTSKDYSFSLVLGTEDIFKASIRVFKVGVLPSTEKDRKDAHSQMMLWDSSGQVWVKAPLKKLKDGTYAIPVVMVTDE